MPPESAFDVSAVTPDDLADLVPLMRAYCTFYESDPSDDDLRAMSRAFLEEGAGGTQLIAPAIVTLSIGADKSNVVRYGIAAAAVVIIVAAVAVSKARDLAIGGDGDGQAAARFDAVAPDAGEAETAPGQAVDDATDTIEEPANR